MTAAGLGVEQAAPVEAGPYKFLDFYREQDQSIFAGRERDIREVVARICTNRTFVLYAASGLGKTSLLLAGVFPKLRDRQFTPVYVRTLEDPLQDLCAAVAREMQAPAVATLEGLTAALEDHPATTVLVLDQFEEFFIHFRHVPQKRAEFVRSIAALARNATLKLRIVFSLREDYLAELDGFRDDVPDLFTNDYRLRPLTAFGARQAIAQPLIVSGVDYDRRLLVRLVDLLADVQFDPVMLQILCTEVYRQAVARAESESRHDARIAETDLHRAGELDGVVRRYLDRVLRAVPKGSVLLSRTVLDAMITREKTKRAVTFEMLKNADFSASVDELERVLATFEQHRLVRSEQRGRELWYELGHERLVQPVDDWLKLDTDFFNFRVARDLVANTFSGEVWRENYETLLSEGQLTHVIRPYEQRLRFPPEQLELLCRSAIFRRVDPSHWMSQLGEAASIRILLEFMESPDEQARVAAAVAAVRYPDSESRLGDRLVELAMGDPSVPVRRAAGRSLAALATDAHFATIRDALTRRTTLGRALNVVADLHQGGRQGLQRFGLWRVLARGVANRRVKHEQAESIRARGRFGIVTGLIAGLAWAITVGLLGGVLAAWAVGFPEAIAGIALGTLAAAVVVGTFLGWRIGRAGALDAGHRGEGRWFHAVMRLRFLYGFTLLFAIGGGLAVMTGDSAMDFLLLTGVIALAAFLVQAVIGATARLARASVWPNVPARGVAFWSLSASAGLPLLLTALTLSLGAALGMSSADWEPLAVTFAGFTSLGAAVALVTLAQTAAAGTGDVPTPRQRRVSQSWSLGLAGGVLLWFIGTYGFDSLPFFARTVHVGPDAPVALQTELRGRFSSASYFQLVVPDPDPEWVQVTDGSQHTETRLGDRSLSRNSAIYLPPGRHRVVMRGYVEEASTDVVRLERIRRVGLSDELLLDWDPIFAVVVFNRVPESNEWHATVSGTARVPFADRMIVRLVSVDAVPDADLPDGVLRGFIRSPHMDRPTSSNVRILGSPMGVVAGYAYSYAPNERGFVSVPVASADGSWRIDLTLDFGQKAAPEQDTVLIPFWVELTARSQFELAGAD
ncbi:MAG TPA: hypothetical protein VMO26_24825 [Vicinamibacterales bacterium]|nr:hypothetical protein [Vicinamibacterales bacterium]